MRRIKLTRQERGIEEALMQGEYLNVDRLEFDEIARAVAHRYQTFLSELIHRVAHS